MRIYKKNFYKKMNYNVTPTIIDFLSENNTQNNLTSLLKKKTGWGKTKCRETIQKFRNGDYSLDKPLPVKQENIESKFGKSTCELTSKSKRIKTLDDLLAETGVDQDIWEVDRYVVNKWEVGVKVDGEILTEPLFQVKAWLKKKKIVEAEKNVIESIIEDMKEFAPTYPTIMYSSIPTDKHLLEIATPDLHLGKLCWKDETGQDYDSNIAKERFLDAINVLVQRARGFEIEEVLFPIGNDFFNVDNGNNTTNAGTPQCEDSRWQKTFLLGGKILIEAIDTLTEIAPVKIVICPGNHDTERSFYMGEYLNAWYHKNENVIVDNSPKLRKYYKYGENLIGYTHGDKEKHKDLPIIMATEAPKYWADTKFRFFHIGHIHSQKSIDQLSTVEDFGVRISALPSLCSTDSWHYGKGYVGNIRAAKANVYDKNEGQVASFQYNVI